LVDYNVRTSIIDDFGRGFAVEYVGDEWLRIELREQVRSLRP
jgi:hypothetical protein